MAALYTDPALIQQATELEKSGHTRDQIAQTMGLGRKTVRKMLDPGFAEAERQRLAAIDKVRASIRRQDPDYRAYQAAAGKSDVHLARVRARKAEREGRIAGPARVVRDEAAAAAAQEASVAVAAGRAVKAERVTAEERRRAATALTRGHTRLSVDASLAANRLMRDRGCAWDELIGQLLIDAAGRPAK